MKQKEKQTLKAPKVVTEKKIPVELMEGLSQTFKDDNNKSLKLHEVINHNDVWQTTGRVKRTILTHDGVKKIADIAGIAKVYTTKILTQPDAYNNYQYTMEVTVNRIKNKNDAANALGEANRSNLGSKGRGNPANMAEKRAYDRAVFRLLGITGLLSEEELSDNETENQMDDLSHEDKKKIAPTINQLLLAKTKQNLVNFNAQMKTKVKDFSPVALDYLRKLYKKKLAELQTSF